MRQLCTPGLIFTLAMLTSSLRAAAVSDITDHNPTGEVANYTLDKAPNRTSSMISDGSVSTHVGGHVDGTNPGYGVDLNYNFVIFGSTYNGTKNVTVPDIYFSADFMAQLRVTKHYETTQFKVDWLAFEDVHTLDGKFYPHTDKIKIYDVNQGMAFDLLNSDVQDLVIIAHAVLGVPVLAAVSLDVSGTYQGLPFKAGGDYQAPQ